MKAFRQRARESAIEWKLTSPQLHDRDRAEGTYRGKGPYPFCLPVGSELMNLLPDARDVGLSRFKEAHIPWHR